MSSPFSLSVPLDSLQGKDWVELSALEQAAAIAVGSVNEYITFNTLLQLDHDTSNRFKVKHFKHLPPFRPLPAPLPAFLPASFSRCLFLFSGGLYFILHRYTESMWSSGEVRSGLLSFPLFVVTPVPGLCPLTHARDQSHSPRH